MAESIHCSVMHCSYGHCRSTSCSSLSPVACKNKRVILEANEVNILADKRKNIDLGKPVPSSGADIAVVGRCKLIFGGYYTKVQKRDRHWSPANWYKSATADNCREEVF